MSSIARMRWATTIILAGAAVSSAGDKPKAAANEMVDSGSFGIFLKGQRVVTENFSIQMNDGINTVKSQIQENGSSGSSAQKSEMKMTQNAELIYYNWSDGKGSLEVTPKDEFLLEKITPVGAKPAEKPFLMPNTSAILDNNFFIHREVLAWRYLGTNCHSNNGEFRCQKEPADFGVLVPQDQTSLRVRMELVGREKVSIRGTERELLRVNLTGEAFSWSLWLDDKDKFKLIRVLIPDANTEVVRD